MQANDAANTLKDKKTPVVPIASRRIPRGATAIAEPILPRLIVSPTRRGYLSEVKATAANISVPMKSAAVPSPENNRDNPNKKLLFAKIKIKVPKDAIKSPIEQAFTGPILPLIDPHKL